MQIVRVYLLPLSLKKVNYITSRLRTGDGITNKDLREPKEHDVANLKEIIIKSLRVLRDYLAVCPY